MKSTIKIALMLIAVATFTASCGNNKSESDDNHNGHDHEQHDNHDHEDGHEH